MLYKNPFTSAKYRITSYIPEAASRNRELDAAYVWLFARAVDLFVHGAPTGRIHGVKRVERILAQKMGRTLKTVRRHLRMANDGGYLDVDHDADVVRIPSHASLTLWLWQRDAAKAQDGLKLPDLHVRHLLDVQELDISIPEVWDKNSKSLRESKFLDVARQRVTERGWCRETFARLVGMDRCSTARLDRLSRRKRGWQYAEIRLSDIRVAQADAAQFISLYHRFHGALSGRGKKVWLKKSPSGEWSLFTQMGVKWDTAFKGRLRPARDVLRKAKSSISHSSLGGCWSLHPAMTGDGRDADAACGAGVVSEGMRKSIWAVIGAVANAMVTSQPLNTRPTIRVSDTLAWSMVGQRSHPNSTGPRTDLQKRPENLGEKNSSTLEAVM